MLFTDAFTTRALQAEMTHALTHMFIGLHCPFTKMARGRTTKNAILGLNSINGIYKAMTNSSYFIYLCGRNVKEKDSLWQETLQIRCLVG